jgi:hypothetical protein
MALSFATIRFVAVIRQTVNAPLLLAHRAIPVTCVSRSASGTCVLSRCSPQSAPFPPRPPPRLAPLCLIGSAVVRRSPTSPARARPPFSLWPSRTGLDPSTKTHRRSPGSRACCFSACAGSTDYAGPNSYSRLTQLPCCLPPLGMDSASCATGFSKLNRPAH